MRECVIFVGDLRIKRCYGLEGLQKPDNTNAYLKHSHKWLQQSLSVWDVSVLNIHARLEVNSHLKIECTN